MTEFAAVLLDFGGVVANVRMKLKGEPGSSPYVADIEAGVIDAVSRLRSIGIKVALVTNNDRGAFAIHFPHLDLDAWFDAVVFSSDVGADKPRPPIYLEALRRIQVEPEDAVFLDDLPRNVDAAVALGMQAVVIESPSGAARYLDGLLKA